MSSFICEYDLDNVSIDQEYTNHYVKGLEIVDGAKSNSQSGSKSTRSEFKSVTNSQALQKKLRCDLKDLNTISILTKELFEEPKKIVQEHDIALKSAIDWEIYVKNHYSEEEFGSIIGMVCYLENIENGFGHRNNEIWFHSERKKDTSEKLFREAKYGFEISKKS